MGPRPNGRGRGAGRTRRSLPITRFNGAASKRTRKDVLYSHCRADLIASMGPRPNGRGRRNHARCMHCDYQGFNGAASKRTRKGAPRMPSSSTGACFNGAASKRTRKGLTAELLALHTIASMGPRPNGRGRRLSYLPRGSEVHGFNGAASKRTRKVRLPVGPRRSMPWLQWGRVQTDAEGGGRRIASARKGVASMGPRPNGRGRSMTVVGIRRRLLGFNGAASKRTRKVAWFAGAVAVVGSFNGAASKRTRKATGRAAVHIGHGGFNGAASKRTRKADGRRRNLLSGMPASMGPRPNGRGRRL